MLNVIADNSRFQPAITSIFLGDFPTAPQQGSQKSPNIAGQIASAIIGTSQTRFGSMPGPDSQRAIEAVITASIKADAPIPVLCPWGSKKPQNSAGIDIAELGGLKTLACLQRRVLSLYPRGLQINLRLEDVGGYYLFADEGDPARAAGWRYVNAFVNLVQILDLTSFIKVRLESEMMGEDEYIRIAENIRPALAQYIQDTDKGFEGLEDLESWRQLKGLGWTGMIPHEQRDYYRERYARIYPGSTSEEQTNRLATYFAGSLARYKLRATGADESWGANFLQLNFAPPAPGTPPSIGDRRVYYRTLPMQMAKTHLPPWRAKGYLKIGNENVTPKLGSWFEGTYVQNCVRLTNGGNEVHVQADISEN